MRVLFEKTLPEYQHTFNVNFEQQFGSAADESYAPVSWIMYALLL